MLYCTVLKAFMQAPKKGWI